MLNFGFFNAIIIILFRNFIIIRQAKEEVEEKNLFSHPVIILIAFKKKLKSMHFNIPCAFSLLLIII